MGKTRLLFVGLAPIQNARPFRLLSQHTGLETEVLYLKASAEDMSGEEFLNKAAFDTTRLDGYQQRVARPLAGNRSSGPLLGLSLDPWHLAASHDIIVVYGHFLVSYWLAILSAKWHRRRLILSTDATSMRGSVRSGGWKLRLKPLIFRWLYNHLADGVFVSSTSSRLFLEQLGVRPDRITVTPYVVDEEHIHNVSASTDVALMREKLEIPQEHVVFVFCAKFLPRKRPLDAILAMAQLNRPNASLLMIGSGPLDGELRSKVTELGLEKSVKFAGLVKYSDLPTYYTASDVLVFCSDHEPYGLPVNEMMLCGHPVIVSDCIGAGPDLVEEGITGWTYPVGDVSSLVEKMREAVDDRSALPSMGAHARKKAEAWSSELNASRQVDYFHREGWLTVPDQHPA
ncbi:glycosyltransferase family 4 protein [Verrucomicrobium sp. BvORR106]|uniref:glycosyltransferase family 4 protein n=1 Tax=Verrucomicrobium sp. BvORR106 TaxID=1403819 RepID=UPI000571D77C|nr:glycosyltransferase family 4 protein [Verrucomicrobium sp. BvORR106]